MEYETFLKLENVYSEIKELEARIKQKRKILFDFYDITQYQYYKKIYSEENFNSGDKEYIRNTQKDLKEILFKI